MKKSSTASNNAMANHFWQDLQTLVGDESDSEAMAYYDTRRMVFDWLAEQGEERGYSEPTKRGNALYYYRQALKYGDLKAAERYLKKYYKLGGEPKLLKQSLKRAHPLASVPKEKRFRFRKSLSEKEQDAVKRAIDWYRRTYGEK